MLCKAESGAWYARVWGQSPASTGSYEARACDQIVRNRSWRFREGERRDTPLSNRRELVASERKASLLQLGDDWWRLWGEKACQHTAGLTALQKTFSSSILRNFLCSSKVFLQRMLHVFVTEVLAGFHPPRPLAIPPENASGQEADRLKRSDHLKWSV
jgi:hypothetical protein